MQRTVTRKQAFFALVLTLSVWLLLLVTAFSLAQRHLQAGFTMQNVPLAIQLPKYMPVKSAVHNRLTAQLDDTLEINVPIEQWVDARFPRAIPVRAKLSTAVELNTQVKYQAQLPVDALFELVVPVKSPIVPAISLDVPVKIPLKFQVPVDLTIPVKETIPVDLDTLVVAEINDPVPALLKTDLYSQVPVRARLNAKVLTQAEALLMFPTAPIDLQLANTDLRIAIGDLSLVRKSLNYPVVTKAAKINPKDLVYVYDAAKKPPVWR